MKKWVKHNKIFLTGTLLALIFPIILNFVLFSGTSRFAFGNGNTWLNFWGSYSGSLISAAVAYFIASSQVKNVKKQMDRQLEDDLLRDKFNRTIDQLPALISLEEELTNAVNGMLLAESNRDFLLKEFKDLTEEESYQIKYNEKYFRETNLKYIDKVERTDLQVEIMEDLRFYDRFRSAISMEVPDYKELETLYSKLNSVNDMDEKLLIQHHILRLETEKDHLKSLKKDIWEQFFDNEILEKTQNTLSKLEEEIHTTKKLIDKPDINLLRELLANN
ncbi:hypothetical protein [Alteribacillus sp. HJP-4]|uniref:hypothetical protein n=1 Tax=Alteribacillus sp. HJP-4 TaxID=2775394 RepID=UPI0035CCEA9A